MKEMVLYYNPSPSPHVAKMKSVLVRMGVRIKNIEADQVLESVGFLAGIEGFEKREAESGANEPLPVISEEVLVMKNFSSSRIDELLMNLRKAGVPKIVLKAVLTEYNCKWTFFQLYEELKEEHEAMSGRQKG